MLEMGKHRLYHDITWYFFSRSDINSIMYIDMEEVSFDTVFLATSHISIQSDEPCNNNDIQTVYEYFGGSCFLGTNSFASYWAETHCKTAALRCICQHIITISSISWDDKYSTQGETVPAYYGQYNFNFVYLNF